MTEKDYLKYCRAYKTARTAADTITRDNAFNSIAADPEVSKMIGQLSHYYDIIGKQPADLKQELLLELIAAINVFDPSKGKFMGLFSVCANRRLNTLLKQQYQIYHGERRNYTTSLDNGPEDTDLAAVLVDREAANSLDDLCHNETFERLFDYLLPRLSPFEGAVFKQFITNRLNGSADYLHIAEKVKHLLPPRQASKSNTPLPKKQIDNAIGRIKRTLKQHKYQIDRILNGVQLLEDYAEVH